LECGVGEEEEGEEGVSRMDFGVFGVWIWSLDTRRDARIYPDDSLLYDTTRYPTIFVLKD
jgi:hypothetical protein